VTQTYRLENDLKTIPLFVDSMLSSCAAGVAGSVMLELKLAVRELIINAVEHGNLELTYEEKEQAVESGELEQVLCRRRQDARLSGRQVVVQAHREGRRLTIEIADEGGGFDWRALPDPDDPVYLFSTHGRGVLLARLSVDSLAYNEAGNRVSVVKLLDDERQDKAA
jgi:anti-sigma regulatory factor (Ser/Thr protein kinase)